MTRNSLENQTFKRAVQLKRDSINEEERTVEVAFSSEKPYRRYFGDEILSHEKSAVDMSFLNGGSAPFLADHKHTDQIGVIEKAWIDSDRKGRALVRFGKSARAEEFFQDVVDGIRSNISVGYTISKYEVDEDKEPPVYTMTKWQPLEISLVSIPADDSVGVGRNHNFKEHRMSDPNTNIPENEPEKVDLEAIRKEARKEEVSRIKEITAAGKQRGFEAEAEKFIADGRSVAEFREHIWDLEEKRQPEITKVPKVLGMSDGELKRYSFMKLVRALATNDWSKAGFERECSIAFEEMTKRQAKGAFIPHDVLIDPRYAQRDLNTITGSAGGYLVSETMLPGSFVDMLRNSSSVMQMGVRVLSGLNGDIDIPKQTGGATAYWVGEADDLSESQQALGQIRMSPKSLGCYTDLTRRMMLQSSMDVETFVRTDFALQMALKVDYTAIAGVGTPTEPRGIINTTGVGSVTLNAANAPDWGDIVDLETAVAIDNALMGSLGYITNATIAGNMKQTEKASGTARFIFEEGALNGYQCLTSNNVPAKYIIFGNYADMIVGMWSGLDVTVDTNTLSKSGGTRIVCFQDCDIAIRNAESFAVGYKA